MVVKVVACPSTGFRERAGANTGTDATPNGRIPFQALKDRLEVTGHLGNWRQIHKLSAILRCDLVMTIATNHFSARTRSPSEPFVAHPLMATNGAGGERVHITYSALLR